MNVLIDVSAGQIVGDAIRRLGQMFCMCATSIPEWQTSTFSLGPCANRGSLCRWTRTSASSLIHSWCSFSLVTPDL